MSSCVSGIHCNNTEVFLPQPLSKRYSLFSLADLAFVLENCLKLRVSDEVYPSTKRLKHTKGIIRNRIPHTVEQYNDYKKKDKRENND